MEVIEINVDLETCLLATPTHHVAHTSIAHLLEKETLASEDICILILLLCWVLIYLP
jgi:hypothetical protein